MALRDTFGASFDWNPAYPGFYSGARIVYSFDSSKYTYLTVSNCCSPGPWVLERDSGNVFSFAQFTAAVPEPQTYAMMALGLAALGLVRRRRQT